jgi:bis(5'-nucleosyl)-tetraphosphatase (symmetrical)
LHPVGDLVNRGPDSLGTLRLLREEGAGGVLGNHDVHALRQAAGLRHGGRLDTLDEVVGTEEGRELLGWLAERPFIRTWDDIICVHAALNPHWQDPVALLNGKDPLVRDEETDFVTRVRFCSPSGERPETDSPHPGPPFEPWYKHFEPRDRASPTLVFGHWAAQGLIQRPQIRGLDSGCVWGRSLSAWIPEEDMIVQVPAIQAWCTP